MRGSNFGVVKMSAACLSGMAGRRCEDRREDMRVWVACFG